MDLQIVKKGLLDYAQRRKKLVLVLAALGFTGYGVLKVYHSPSVAQKRQRLIRLFGALVSITEAASESAEAIGVVSRDLRQFLQSDSDQIPNSLKQIAKITNSAELSSSVAKLTQALTVGIWRSHSRSSGYGDRGGPGSSFSEKVVDKMFSDAGCGFASVVVGSFARNLVMGFYADGGSRSNQASVSGLVDVVCGDECRKLIGDCVQLCVSTAVAVYLDKTMSINTYDELFSGLTNPKHSSEVRDMMVSICNGAVHTLVKTSHQVLTTASCSNVEEMVFSELKARNLVEGEVMDYRWDGSVASTLAVPSNRRFILDVAGRVTFQTVRSFLDFLLEKVYGGMRRCGDMVYEAAVEGPCHVLRYVSAKSSVVATLCLSLCLQILGGVWILVPA